MLRGRKEGRKERRRRRLVVISDQPAAAPGGWSGLEKKKSDCPTPHQQQQQHGVTVKVVFVCGLDRGGCVSKLSARYEEKNNIKPGTSVCEVEAEEAVTV